MDQSQHDKIKEIVQMLLQKMGISGQVATRERLINDRKNIALNIAVGDDSRLLIGQGGENLRALEHIARQLVSRSVEHDSFLSLDINNYTQDKEKRILTLARKCARQALREKKPVILEPMNPRERRMVHTTLALDETVTTQSIGEGDERKIVIKPAGIGGTLT